VLAPGAADAALLPAHPEAHEERAFELLAPPQEVLHEGALLPEPGADAGSELVGLHLVFLQCNF
jgi:hypothetical protein